MSLALVLLTSALFPVACLGFVLWMARIEEAIPEAVRRAVRTPDPPPVLAIPLQRSPQRSEGSRSGAVSLGGSTNR